MTTTIQTASEPTDQALNVVGADVASLTYTDQGRHQRAVPVANECGEPAAFTSGPVPYQAGPIPIPTCDGALLLAAEILFGEDWAERHNAETWGNENGFRNQADGYFGSERHRDRAGSDGVDHVQMRPPTEEDLPAIARLIRTGEPFLTAHDYLSWMYLRYFGDTCAVAEHQSEIVGWWSIIPVGRGKYFIHQMAVAPGMRRQRIGRSLAAYLLTKLKDRHAALEFEFTVDRKNTASLNLIRAIAEDAGMSLEKSPEPVPLVKEGSEEELYIMKPQFPCGPGEVWCLPDTGNPEE